LYQAKIIYTIIVYKDHCSTFAQQYHYNIIIIYSLYNNIMHCTCSRLTSATTPTVGLSVIIIIIIAPDCNLVYITCNNNNITYSIARCIIRIICSVVRLIMTSKVAIERSRLLLLLYYTFFFYSVPTIVPPTLSSHLPPPSSPLAQNCPSGFQLMSFRAADVDIFVLFIFHA